MNSHERYNIYPVVLYYFCMIFYKKMFVALCRHQVDTYSSTITVPTFSKIDYIIIFTIILYKNKKNNS